MWAGDCTIPPPHRARSPYLQGVRLHTFFSVRRLGRAGHCHVAFHGAFKALCGALIVDSSSQVRGCPEPTCKRCVSVLDAWDEKYFGGNQ